MTTLAAIPLLHTRPLSPRRLALRRFTQNRLALISLFLLIAILLTCTLGLTYSLAHAPNQSPRYEQINFTPEPLKPFSTGPLLGTDKLGRDMLARLILGGAISLGVGFSSAAISVLIGTTVGLLSGYLGGRTDAILMRIVDVLYSLPYILIVILLRVSVAPMLGEALGGDAWAHSLANVIILLVGIGGVSWLTMARVIRGQVMSIRHQPFIEAARALGLNQPAILLRHILPNLTGTIVVYATLTVPKAILEESFLSFLGLGISAPLPSWGNLASDGVETLNPIHNWWWLVILPSLAISLTLLCLNFIGDGLRDVLDPKTQK